MISSIVGTVNSYSTVYSADKSRSFLIFFFFVLGCNLLHFVLDYASLGACCAILSPDVFNYLAMCNYSKQQCNYSLVLGLFSCLSILRESWTGPGNKANSYILAALLAT